MYAPGLPRLSKTSHCTVYTSATSWRFSMLAAWSLHCTALSWKRCSRLATAGDCRCWSGSSPVRVAPELKWVGVGGGPCPKILAHFHKQYSRSIWGWGGDRVIVSPPYLTEPVFIDKSALKRNCATTAPF